MKNMLAKSLLALGVAVGIAGVSSQALACGSCCHSRSGVCHRAIVYTVGYGCCSGHYHRYHGQMHFQGRPLKVVDGSVYYVQKCTGWHHHKCCW